MAGLPVRLPELKYPDRINCAVELLDRRIATGQGDRPCLISPAESLSYAQLAERVNRIANVLTRDLGLVPVTACCCAAQQPMMVAAYLAVIKAGGVVVATMPLLRAKEIAYPITKAKIRLAFCDHRLAEEMEKGVAARRRSRARRVLGQRSA
jgi:Acyl-coenzyme A synthetases/AMP-(fatty) acid ligases